MARTSKKVQPWQLLSTKELFAVSPWIKVYEDTIKLPSGRIVEDYYRIALPEYAMIYAQRKDGKVLFERQYKHGLGKITLVLPAGALEKGERAIETAKRELLEETGYQAGRWKYVGSFLVNGNKGCGRAHFFIAKELEKISEPVIDDMEEPEIVFISEHSIMKAIFNGEISTLATASLVAIATNPAISQIY
ncbi:NUDIX hydrolase [bacterium]|nr:NUDIX hydrolase [bacterium]